MHVQAQPGNFARPFSKYKIKKKSGTSLSAKGLGLNPQDRQTKQKAKFPTVHKLNSISCNELSMVSLILQSSDATVSVQNLEHLPPPTTSPSSPEALEVHNALNADSLLSQQDTHFTSPAAVAPRRNRPRWSFLTWGSPGSHSTPPSLASAPLPSRHHPQCHPECTPVPGTASTGALGGPIQVHGVVRSPSRALKLPCQLLQNRFDRAQALQFAPQGSQRHC